MNLIEKNVKKATKMEIINSIQFNRANIKFNGKPSAEVRTAMKNEGWVYSSNHDVWYPKNDAAVSSIEFAKKLQNEYFPDQNHDLEIITEESEKMGIQELIRDSKSVDEVLAKLIDLYGIETIKKALNTIQNNNTFSESIQKLVLNKERQMEDHNNDVEQASDERYLNYMEIRTAQSKFDDIVRGTFLALSDEEKENGTTVEQKNTRYEKWFRPMVDEIMAEISNGNKEVMAIVQNFDLNHESHVQGNKWYSPDEAYTHDVQYKLLPKMYEKVQDRIKKEYEEKKIPYVVMYSSESPKFPSKNKVYTVKEFNEILLQADSEFHNRKKYAKEKYGSADNYWDLERDDKLPEEDKGIQFGYDKTNFKFFNIPNPNNPEDTFSYEPSRYDIGDGNGSVFDYVRSTCSHDEFIEALNALETQLYFPGVTDSQREYVEKTVEEETQVLKANLKEKMEDLDKAQNEYKELHKKWLIEATEADRVDEMLKNALDGVKEAYDSSMNDVFTKVLNEYPFASGDVAGSEFLKYTANEVKKMAVSELYLPSRNAQKAMNAEDYKTYKSIDWVKLRRIWEKFPANINITAYAEKLLQDKCAEKGMSVQIQSRTVTPPSPTQEEIDEARRLASEARAEAARKKYEAEQGSNYDSSLSTTDIAKKLRTYVKENYPEYKFSITSKYFSGGSEINVSLKDIPVELTNFETMKAYIEKYSGNFDRIWDEDLHTYTSYYGLDEEGKNRFVEKQLRVMPGHSISRHNLDEQLEWMIPEAKKVMKDVVLQLESYNFDHSESQSDYYHVNFWSGYGIDSSAIEKSLQLNKEKLEQKHEVNNEISEPIEISIVTNQKNQAPNLAFSSKPTEEMRNEMKAAGWIFNPKENVWCPRTKEAQSNSAEFAENFKHKYEAVELPWDENISPEMEKRIDSGEIFGTYNESIPEQKAYHTLIKEDVKNLQIISDEEFSEYAPKEEKKISKTELRFNNEEFEQENVIGKEASFRYKLLSRMQQDCEYYLGNGNRNPKHLWALEEVEHIKNMVSLYNSFSFEDKPEWLTIEQLDNFSKELTGKSLEENGWMDTINENNVFQEHPEYFAEYTEKEEVLNVINFSNWTYFNSEKISTKVYDVEISASLYEQLLPSEYKERSIKEDEVVCIQYRKSVVSEEQDQFLISKFNKNNFMLLQQKEIQIDVELKNKIKSICNSYIEPQNNNSYTNEILDKIRAAGIEVVTDKDEFDRILEQEEKLQKMVDSVESIESLFNTNNNENLNSDIDSVTPNDINVKFTQINISQTTPFIFKECGLDEYPVNIYKQKLARAFFLEKEKFGERRTHGHKGEFTSQEVKEVFKNFGNPRYIFNSRYNISNTADFYLIGVYDTFDLNGEPMMVSLHFNKNEKEVEANWITSVYGKNKNILVDDWTKKGYLIYKNDLDIEKAPEEVVTLYMRVSKSSSAYEHNILLKSNIVNDMGIMYMKENNNTYGFVHNGKIYLNPDFMNSNAAVHEYTHLWDAYTQKTNPELWNKGLELFKDTQYWNEVISDPNYQDIKDDENLVLSEIHSRICGDIAEKVLNRIAELDGEQVKLDAIDWNKKVYFYIREEFELDEKYKSLNFTAMNTTVFLTEFLSTPMKDLMASKNINVSKELSWEELASLFQEQDSSTLGDFKTTKETVQKEETFETEKEYKDEVVLRRLDDILDFHAYNNDGTDVADENGNPYSDKVLEEKYLVLEQISAGIVDGKITSLDNAQILLNEKLLNSELYKEVSKKLKKEAELNRPAEPLRVYTFSPFGYEGTIVQVETDLRRGIPSYDIVGIADSAVKVTRERIRTAFGNSGLEMPAERILQALSPADLRKDSPMDLAMAVGILNEQNHWTGEPVLALGELELSGRIRPVRGAVAAVNSAKAAGITNIVCDPTTAELLKDIDGIKILSAEDLKDVHEKLQQQNLFSKTNVTISKSSSVEFNNDEWIEEAESMSKATTVQTEELNPGNNDPYVTPEQIKEAENEQERILETVLNGERTGMYKAFKDFKDRGVFDIKGAQVKLAKNGGLTPTGWKQLHAAMEIYRSKKFETFRYIMIDRKTGEIADQLAITSHMPNFCNVSKPNDETLKQVISRAEEKDYLIAVCHNHPSGNTTESSFDRELTDSLDCSLRRNDGLNRFLGHIILDHDTFNLAVPSPSRAGHCNWKKMEPMEVTSVDRFTADPKPEWAGNYVGGTTALKEVAKKVNDTENWNDDFIPVVFTNADRNISGVQYYSKNFFENESDKVRNEFQFAAMEAGAIGAFPVITDSLWNKLGNETRDFEAIMKAHVLNDAFTDVAFNHTTMTEKYDIEAGRNYFNFYRDQTDKKIDVTSTWEPKVNTRLFPQEVQETITQYQTLQKSLAKEKTEGIFNHNFMLKNNFYPPFIVKNNKYIVRCTNQDLSAKYQTGKDNYHLNLEITKEQFAKAIATHKVCEKIKRYKDAKEKKQKPIPITSSAVIFENKAHIAVPSNEQKALIVENNLDLKGKNSLIKDEFKKMAEPLAWEVSKIEPIFEPSVSNEKTQKNMSTEKNQEEYVGFDM